MIVTSKGPIASTRSGHDQVTSAASKVQGTLYDQGEWRVALVWDEGEVTTKGAWSFVMLLKALGWRGLSAVMDSGGSPTNTGRETRARVCLAADEDAERPRRGALLRPAFGPRVSVVFKGGACSFL